MQESECDGMWRRQVRTPQVNMMLRLCCGGGGRSQKGGGRMRRGCGLRKVGTPQADCRSAFRRDVLGVPPPHLSMETTLARGANVYGSSRVAQGPCVRAR